MVYYAVSSSFSSSFWRLEDGISPRVKRYTSAMDMGNGQSLVSGSSKQASPTARAISPSTPLGIHGTLLACSQS